jgi:hypothetical protein
VPFVVIEKVIVTPRASARAAGATRRLDEERSVRERLAAEEGEVDARALLRAAHEEIDRLLGDRALHVLRVASELALLRVAVGAAEVALLRDRERERVHRRRGEGRVVHVRSAVDAERCEQRLDRAARDRLLEARGEARVGVEEAAPVGQEHVRASLRAEEVQRRRAWTRVDHEPTRELQAARTAHRARRAHRALHFGSVRPRIAKRSHFSQWLKRSS